jgi:hypothetical protein
MLFTHEYFEIQHSIWLRIQDCPILALPDSQPWYSTYNFVIYDVLASGMYFIIIGTGIYSILPIKKASFCTLK